MHRYAISGLVLILMGGMARSGGLAAAAPDAQPRWSVRIELKSATGQPAAGYRLVLDHLRSGQAFAAQTRAGGVANLELPEGPYTLRVFSGDELVMVRRLVVRPEAGQRFVWTLPRRRDVTEENPPEGVAPAQETQAPAPAGSPAEELEPASPQTARPTAPGDPTATWEAAMAAVQAQDYADALPLWEAYLRVRPRDPNGLYNMGLTLLRLGRCEEALDYFRQVLDVDPQAHAARVAQAECYQQLARWSAALDVYRDLTERFPERYRYWFNMGVCAYRVGDYRTARRAWQRVLELVPDSVEANLVRTWLARLGPASPGEPPSP